MYIKKASKKLKKDITKLIKEYCIKSNLKKMILIVEKKKFPIYKFVQSNSLKILTFHICLKYVVQIDKNHYY